MTNNVVWVILYKRMGVTMNGKELELVMVLKAEVGTNVLEFDAAMELLGENGYEVGKPCIDWSRDIIPDPTVRYIFKGADNIKRLKDMV